MPRGLHLRLELLTIFAALTLCACGRTGYPDSWPLPAYTCHSLDGYFSSEEVAGEFRPGDPVRTTAEAPLPLFFDEQEAYDLKYNYYPARISDIRISTTEQGIVASAIDRGTIVLSRPLKASCRFGQLTVERRRTRGRQTEIYKDALDVASDGSLAKHIRHSNLTVLLIIPAWEEQDARYLWRRSDQPSTVGKPSPRPLPELPATVSEPTWVKGLLVRVECPFHCALTVRTDDGTEHTHMCGGGACEAAEKLIGKRVSAVFGPVRTYLGLPDKPFGLTDCFYSLGLEKPLAGTPKSQSGT